MTPPRTSSSRSTGPRRSTSRPGRKLLNHDRKLELRYVAGADEVGRGCLAGPLVAAAVVFDYNCLSGPNAAPLGQLNDSKKLTPVDRERLAEAVLECAHAWAVVSVSPATIDRIGLHVSNLRALRQAVERVRCSIDVALVDGFHVRDWHIPSRRIVRGDSTSAAIAAASILAKVSRDRLMCRLDEQMQGRWAFSEHMGYATPLHHERIHEHGVSSHHRRSFDSSAYTADMWDLTQAGEGVPRPAQPLERVGDVIDLVDTPPAVAMHQIHVEAVALDALL